MLITVNSDLKVQGWNESASQMTAIPLSQARGERIDRVFAFLIPLCKVLRSCIEKQEMQKLQKVPVVHNTKQMLINIMIYPIETDNRQVIIIEDITDAVRMENMMIQTEKMMSVGGLAAGMAHEINNPLAGMIQNAQVIENRLMGDLPANQKEAQKLGLSLDLVATFMKNRKIPDLLHSLRISGDRAGHIVSNMLSFSRKSSAEFSNENICDLLEKAILLAQNDYNLKKGFDFKQIRIEKEYESDIPEVECEANNLQQVFLNILKTVLRP
jgi:nitrogen-specific signal transduction histidine kinase